MSTNKFKNGYKLIHQYFIYDSFVIVHLFVVCCMNETNRINGKKFALLTSGSVAEIEVNLFRLLPDLKQILFCLPLKPERL